MRRSIFCFTFFLLFSATSMAQQYQIDSLKNSLLTSQDDTTRFSILYQLAETYTGKRIDSMLYYAQELVLFANKAKKNLHARAEVDAMSLLGHCLWYAGNYVDAKATYFEALEKAEELNDTLLIADMYNGIAKVNRNEGDFRQAINYYSKAETFARHFPDNDIFFSTLADKGKAYEQLNILDSAFTYTQECLAMMHRKYKDKNIIGGAIHADMAIIYSKLGKAKLAEEFFRLSIQLTSEINEQRLLARAYVEFAEHFDRFHQPDSAIFYATKGYLVDSARGYLVQQLAASTLLSKLFEQKNQVDSAFKYQRIMIRTRDSVFSNEKINRLQTLEFNENLRQLEKQEAEKQANEERAQNLQYAAIAFGLVILLIAFLLLSYSVVVNQTVIRFLGILSLLIFFEFINLLLHPSIGNFVHHSPLLMLCIMVCIAAILIPLHHKLEHWLTHKLIEKNNKIRLAAAKRTIHELKENEDQDIDERNSEDQKN